MRPLERAPNARVRSLAARKPGCRSGSSRQKKKQRDTNGSTFVAGVINIEALRHHRASAQVTNWMKDVRSELAQIIYEKPIYPKNRYMRKIPGKHADYKRDVIDKQVALMQKRKIWKKPSK